jgi:hypothetical protein
MVETQLLLISYASRLISLFGLEAHSSLVPDLVVCLQVGVFFLDRPVEQLERVVDDFDPAFSVG